jgi:hypothetical protein
MPSRKQRRRRAKERRHEYEFVYVDSEGREVDVDPDEIEAPQPKTRDNTQSAAKRTNGRATAATARSATGRKVDPPSWRRALKRALIFAPFMFVTLYFIDRGASVGVRVLVTVQMLIFFIPFTYVIDRMMYRRFGASASGSASTKDGRKK